ncbi:MAG: hypothetical protein LIO62_01435 [Clostridiales bacterium]|nr:hypothetical protein [Clostridiales bacterium]
MDDFLDIIYDIQRQSMAADKINIDSKVAKLLKEKDKLESNFADVLLKGQEIPFDNFMDSLDKCNDDLRKASFKSGFAMALSLIKDAIKYPQNMSDNSIFGFLEGLQ